MAKPTTDSTQDQPVLGELKQQDWFQALEAAVGESSQSAVARRLGVSPTTVNQALKGAYKGSLKNVEARVRGALMNATVDCPVLGDIPKNRCQDWQAKPKAFTNSFRRQMYKACRNCPHSKLKQETDE